MWVIRLCDEASIENSLRGPVNCRRRRIVDATILKQ
jgi:hypothetical protein